MAAPSWYGGSSAMQRIRILPPPFAFPLLIEFFFLMRLQSDIGGGVRNACQYKSFLYLLFVEE